MEKLIRKAEVARALGVSVTTLWRMRGTDPMFPKARQVTRGGVVGFLESEIAAYLRSRPEADESKGRARVAHALRARGIPDARTPEAAQ